MTTDTKPLAERLRHVRFRAEEGAGSRPAKESVKVRPTDWHSVCDGLTEAADALDAKDALLREAMEALKPFSVIADGTDFLGDGQSVGVNVNRCRDARAILSKLTEATKP